MKIHVVAALLIGALFALPAWAAVKPSPAVNASNKAAFETVSTWVRKQMDTGGRYSDVTTSDRAKVDSQLDSMDKLFQEHPDVAQMTPEQKTRMFNSQEEVNAILAKRDDQRLICRSEAPVGSHIPVRTCRTVRELADQRRGTDIYLRQENTRSNQVHATAAVNSLNGGH